MTTKEAMDALATQEFVFYFSASPQVLAYCEGLFRGLETSAYSRGFVDGQKAKEREFARLEAEEAK